MTHHPTRSKDDMNIKSFPAFISEVKAEGDIGIVKAFVSVMGNVDKHWDVIQYGAFTKTINESAHKIKVLDNHNSRSAEDAIAKLLSIREIPKSGLPAELLSEFPDATGGLYVEFQFLLDEPTDKSAKIFRRIKAGVIDEYSIGFRIMKGEWREVVVGGEQHEIYFILEVDLKEFSPVVFAANTATMTVEAKADEIDPVLESPEPSQIESAFKVLPLTKAIDGYAISIANENCGGCEFYKAVTAKNGFCAFHNEAVQDKYICDEFIELKITDTVGVLLRAGLTAFFDKQVSGFKGSGALQESDMDLLNGLIPTVIDTVLNIIPVEVLGREIPIEEYEAPKSEKHEAEPSESPLTSEADSQAEIVLRDLQIKKAKLIAQKANLN